MLGVTFSTTSNLVIGTSTVLASNINTATENNLQCTGRPPNQPGIFECIQKHDSPLWKKRLPFFVMYFIGASWIAVGGSFRFLRIIQYSNNNEKKEE